MKLWDILVTANANLLRNKVRTTLTIIAVFIGAFTITLTAAANAGVNDFINRQLGTLGGNNVLLVEAKGTHVANTTGPKKYDPNQSKVSGLGISVNTLTDSDVTKIAGVAGVKNVTPQLPVTVSYAVGPNEQKYQLSVKQMIDGINVDMEQGNAPDNTAAENQLDLEPDYATALGFKSDTDAIGKTITLGVATPVGVVHDITAKVVGVQNSSLLASGGGMINNALTQAIYDIQTEGVPAKIKDQYVAVAATLTANPSAQDVQTTKNAINKLGFYALTVQDEIGTVSTILNAITIALIGFGGVALVAASFGVINTLFMAVQERTKEIGLMKAMGMSGRRVFFLFSVEAILLGFWGSLIGVVAAYFAGQGINHIASATFLKDLKHFTLLEIPLAYVVAIIVVIMLIAYLAGTLPARRAARQNPIDALRYE